MKKLILIILLFPLAAMAQVSSPSIIPVVSAPSGACSQVLPDQQTTVAGVIYTCQNGTWAAVSGGGGGSLPTASGEGQIIAATGAGTTYQATNISKIPVEFGGATAYSSEAAAEAGPDDTANFQSVVTAAAVGMASCQAGKWYHVEGPLVFSTNEGLAGTSDQAQGGKCQLVSNSASSNILSVGATAGVTIENVAVYRSTAGTGTSTGLSADSAGSMTVRNFSSYDSIRDIYRHNTPDSGGAEGTWQNVKVGWLLNETSGTYYGIYDDSADGVAMFSVILKDAQANCANLGASTTSYGQYIVGTLVSDNDTDNFSSNTCTYGQALSFTGTGSGASCSDIHWWNSTHDNFRTNAFSVSGCTATQTGSVEISGGWAVTGPQTSATGANISILNSAGVSVNHVQIGGHSGGNHPAQYGIIISGGSGNSVVGNTILNQAFAVNLTNSTTWNTVVGNTITNTTGGSLNPAMQINNSAGYNIVSSNTIAGANTWATGLSIASGSNNNVYVGNSCGSGVTTCISDSGTGNGPNLPPFTITGFNAGTGASIKAITTTTSSEGFLAQGPNDFAGESDATPSHAFAFGYTIPGGTAGTSPGYYAYGGSSWHNIWSVNDSTFAMTFAGAINPPAARKGTFVCTVGGTITIANANELVTSDVIISLNTAGGTISTAPAMKTVTSGTGFTVLCGAADTSTYNYTILN